MSVSDMRRYLANGQLGSAAAPEQLALLEAQQEHLEAEARSVALRRRYVGLKIEYWQAIQAGDQVRVERLSNEARTLADDLKKSRRP
jgi:hypothetical protein